MRRTAVLDGDMFVYKVGHAAMKEIMFDEYVISIGDYPEAVVALENWIDAVTKKIDVDGFTIAFTSKNNFRKEIYPEYKANRTKNKKPYLVKQLQEYCERTYKCLTVDGLEADDIIGQAMTNPRFGDVIGVSMDKDMLTIPGATFNPDKDAIVQRTSLLDATVKFYVQTLTGDAVDNYKGCPGIGEVKAYKAMNKVLDECTTNGHTEYLEFVDKGWEIICKLFEKSYLTAFDAWENASMAKILWYGEPTGGFMQQFLKDYYKERC